MAGAIPPWKQGLLAQLQAGRAGIWAPHTHCVVLQAAPTSASPIYMDSFQCIQYFTSPSAMGGQCRMIYTSSLWVFPSTCIHTCSWKKGRCGSWVWFPTFISAADHKWGQPGQLRLQRIFHLHPESGHCTHPAHPLPFRGADHWICIITIYN